MDCDRIIALDLGKFKTVACVMNPATRQHQFHCIVMSPGHLHDLLAAHATPSPQRTLVVFETCDTAGWVHDVCSALGVGSLCTHGNGQAWQWRRVKRKTDRDDALKLARLALMDQLPAVHVPSPTQRQKRRLILHRRSVVTRRTASRNAIRAIFNQQGLPLVRGNKQWTRAGIEQLREHARPIDQCEVMDLWRGRLQVELELIEAVEKQLKAIDAKLDELSGEDARVKLLQTIKGVGPRTAEAVVLHLDDPNRFKSADEVANYAGLVPRQLESGQMSRYGHITRRGPALLRSVMVEAAWVVWRHNDWAQAFILKISHGSRSRRKLAIVALARKLLEICWSMLKHHQPFRRPELRPAVPTT